MRSDAPIARGKKSRIVLSDNVSVAESEARCVVVAPTFDHAALVPPVLNGLVALHLPVIVIDDGSRDGTPDVLRTWARGDPAQRFVVTHAANQGKANALRTGFAEARRRGFTHAVTIDTDGQHEPTDVGRLVAIARGRPDAIVLGSRSSRTPGYPIAGRVGRALSNHFVWLTSGVRVSDSQSGLRVYPLEIVDRLGARAARYAYETEVLVRAGWAGVPIIETPIECIYRVPGGRVSHFKIGRDTRSAVALHAAMLTRSWLPGEPVPRVTPDKAADTGTVFQRACGWFSPRRLIRMARGPAQARERLAASVGTGLFMASVPAYGIKTVACLWLSARFRLHPTAVIGVSSLSTPPLGLVFIMLSVLVGHLMLHGSIPDAAIVTKWRDAAFDRMRHLLLEWVLGSLVVGAVLGVAGYALTRWSLSRGCRAPLRTDAAAEVPPVTPSVEARSEPATP